MTQAGSVGGPQPRGVGDEQLEARIQARFDALMETWPSYATGLGIHEHDHRLADLSRAAKEADIAAERGFISDLVSTDTESLSERMRFELDVALHGARLRLFDDEVGRGWERRTSASDEIGEALFLLLARDFAPFEERLGSLSARIEGIPTALQQVRDRLGDRPVRLWMELERLAAAELPLLVHETVQAAQRVWPAGSSDLRRLMAAARATREALFDYAAWIEAGIEDTTTDIALGGDQFDELIGLRAFDGLDTDRILAIGWDELESMHEARRDAGQAIDPSLSEIEVVERVKAEGPADFDAALAAYRDAMWRARDFIAEHDLATLPVGDVLEVMATPKHMRSTTPLAAYFQPAAFDRPMRGVYIVTPSVNGDAGAMLEHNWASIVNTSVHEAYPGHHLQLSAALSTPTPARLLVEAPELVEGWGMYSEQMMLEQGFEDSPERRVIVATDAIWRAARIILDIRLHRGEISVAEAIDFLVEHTRFERPVARAEVYRYTQTPTYNLSYLLGKVLLLRLRADEQERLGDSFSLKAYHDALLYSGSLPVSFQRRLLAGQGGGPTLPGPSSES
jgi:uncharacterized protein (DUF885 family)